MKILLVYPETPTTFWSFRNALKFIAKASSEPPLGLLTVAALLPSEWEKRLIDTNVRPLTNEEILWADYVFLTGMDIHRHSFSNIVRRCNELGTPVVAGGPMVTLHHREFLGVDHFVLNEAEITLPRFLQDLQAGRAKRVYTTSEFPDMSTTPVPMWQLLDMKKYSTMSVQYSRGCPYNCEFCSIISLNGRRPRTKTAEQFLAELDSLYKNGWRGSVFVVDDNFIGNRKRLKQELLPALIRWSREHHHPFQFTTEASLHLADDDDLIRLMVDAGFDHVFLGIETPNPESLAECGKKHNLKTNMTEAVRKLHRAGLIVSGGFIIGFDNDTDDIFEQQIQFIRDSRIVTAMVGLLNAPRGTRLFRRLQKENRLLEGFSGDNMDGSINFIPKMNYQKLISGYKTVLETIYSPREYYARVKAFLQEYQPQLHSSIRIRWQDIRALFRSFWILGVKEIERRYYWRLILASLVKFPRKFTTAVTLAIYGFHFRKVVERV